MKLLIKIISNVIPVILVVSAKMLGLLFPIFLIWDKKDLDNKIKRIKDEANK